MGHAGAGAGRPDRCHPGIFQSNLCAQYGRGVWDVRGARHCRGAFHDVLVTMALFLSKGLNWARLEPNLVGGCLAGGAVGNLVDRVRIGHVVDFLISMSGRITGRVLTWRIA